MFLLYRCMLMLSCVVSVYLSWFFFFKQKTAYEMRISDWSSDVFASDARSRICLRAFNPQLAADMLDRKELAANVQHELAAAQPTHFRRPRPEAFHDMRQGNDERLVPNCHDHAVGNGKGQRHGKREGAAVAGARMDADPEIGRAHG